MKVEIDFESKKIVVKDEISIVDFEEFLSSFFYSRDKGDWKIESELKIINLPTIYQPSKNENLNPWAIKYDISTASGLIDISNNK